MRKDKAVGEFMANLVADMYDSVIESVERYAGQAPHYHDIRMLEDALESPQDKTVFIAQLACMKAMGNLFHMLGSDSDVKVSIRNVDAGVDWVDLADIYYGEELAAALICKGGWLETFSKYPNIVSYLSDPKGYAEKFKAAIQEYRKSMEAP